MSHRAGEAWLPSCSEWRGPVTLWSSWGSLGAKLLVSPLYSCLWALKSPWLPLHFISDPLVWFLPFIIVVSYLSHFCLLSHLLSFWTYAFLLLSQHPSGFRKKTEINVSVNHCPSLQNVNSLFSFSNTENGWVKEISILLCAELPSAKSTPYVQSLPRTFWETNLLRFCVITKN